MTPEKYRFMSVLFVYTGSRAVPFNGRAVRGAVAGLLSLMVFASAGAGLAATGTASAQGSSPNPTETGAAQSPDEERAFRPGRVLDTYGFQWRGAFGTAGELPFWLHSNRYGELDTQSANTTLSLFGTWSHTFDAGPSLSAGADLSLRGAENSSVWLQEAYLQAGYGHFVLWAGRKKEYFGLVHHELSMGTTDLSQNARPIPKITLATDGFQPIPGTRRVMYYSASLAHGWMYDDDYRFVDRVRLHQKHLYLQIFSDDAPIVPRAGLKHFAQWGGNSPRHGEAPVNLRTFRDVFFSLAADSKEIIGGGELLNVHQNHLGTYDFSLTANVGRYRMAISRQFILEDTPNARFGTPWDGMWGAYIELRPDSRTRWRSGGSGGAGTGRTSSLRAGQGAGQNGGAGQADRRAAHRPLIRAVLYEYLDTKEGIDRYPHRDMTSYFNYYNHSAYRGGWTYHGRSLGNPLFFSHPDYLGVINNIILAHHFGAVGHAGPVDWRLLTTYSRNYGAGGLTTTDRVGARRPNERRDQWSWMLELKTGMFHPSLEAATTLALDTGEAHPGNFGAMVTLRWRAR